MRAVQAGFTIGIDLRLVFTFDFFLAMTALVDCFELIVFVNLFRRQFRRASRQSPLATGALATRT